MEAQLTDFENAALTVITVLLSRVLLYFRLNLYIPLSKVDDNMVTAHKRDAVVAVGAPQPVLACDPSHRQVGAQPFPSCFSKTLLAEPSRVTSCVAPPLLYSLIG